MNSVRAHMVEVIFIKVVSRQIAIGRATVVTGRSWIVSQSTSGRLVV